MQYTLRSGSEETVSALAESLTFDDQSRFSEMIEKMAGSGGKNFVLDLSNLKSIDSGGLGMFLIANDQIKEGGGALTLRNAQGYVKKVIDVAGIGQFLTVE